MKHFPAICVDDFYEEPERVRDFALTLPFYPSENGAWPGKRTDGLHKIDRTFFDEFCFKLFSIYYDLNFLKVDWTVSTNFQIVEPYSQDERSPKNKGWIHLDDDSVFAGLIYLTPDINLNCGTSLYQAKDQKKVLEEINFTKQKFYESGIDENYDQEISKHHNHFVETVRFNNIFNRMISFDAASFHAANNFFDDKNVRLTQVFFVNSIQSQSKTPLQRLIRKQEALKK